MDRSETAVFRQPIHFAMICLWAGFSFLLFSPSFVAASAAEKERPYIISGFDDVLRQAENTGLLRAALRIFEGDKSFTGMSELYTGISLFERPPKFAIVSAISNWFDGRIERFLLKSKYPENRRYLRHWLTEWSIEDFKIQKIAEIVKQQPDRDYIVIFDNSSASIGLATRLVEEFPGKIKTVYLRQVVEKPTPKNAVSFFSAFEIAVHEFAEGRLGREEVEKVADAILKEADAAMIFPPYAICPQDYNPCDRAEGALVQKCAMVRAHVQGLCKRRD